MVHLAVSLTGSSKSVGSSPVFMGNHSPGPRLTCLIINPRAASCLPFVRGVVHVRLFHGGDNPVNGGGPEHYQHSDRE